MVINYITALAWIIGPIGPPRRRAWAVRVRAEREAKKGTTTTRMTTK